jgi:hypothetical protein
MKETFHILPLLPLLTPLIGAFIAWILPSRSPAPRIRRWLYVLTLLVASSSLLVLGAHDSGGLEIPFWRPLYIYGEALRFSFDILGINLAVLLVGMLAFVGLSLLNRPMERFEGVILLLLVGAGIGICAASNLVTLCLLWVLMDLALLGLDIVRVPDESIPHAIRNVLGNLVSTTALVIATVLLMVEQGDANLADLTLQGLPLQMMMLAALLRLGIYPLPGSLKRRWEAYLASLCTGGYLWLRLTSLSPQGLADTHWLIPLCGGALLITGLLAGLSLDLATALPYILLNGVTAVVLAPLLDPTTGPSVGFITAINVGLCLALLRIDVQVRPISPFGRWARLPLGLTLASLAGWPLTLGFVTHWAFLKLCWTGGWYRLAWLGSASYLLTSIPMWQRLRQIRREVREDGAPSHWNVHVAMMCASIVSLFLILLGVYPALLERAWPVLSGRFRLPTLATLGAGGWHLVGGLLLMVVIVPGLGSHVLQRLRGNIPSNLARGFDAVSALLELDWFYLGAERMLTKLRVLMNQAVMAMEEGLCLGWVLLWSLVIVLYLVGR